MRNSEAWNSACRMPHSQEDLFRSQSPRNGFGLLSQVRLHFDDDEKAFAGEMLKHWRGHRGPVDIFGGRGQCANHGPDERADDYGNESMRKETLSKGEA